jgi:cytochrome P450
MLSGLRTRVMSWVARRYLVRAHTGGLDLAELSLLPDAALIPLRRDGLDPVPSLGAQRQAAPISRLPLPFGVTAWLVTGHAEAREILATPTAFSNDFANLVGNAGISAQHNPGGLGFADPPHHTRLRRILTPEFTMRRLSRLIPRIDSIVGSQLDAMAAQDGPVDLVEHFALPIPSLTICELLGVPYEDRAEFQRLSMTRFDLFGGAGSSLGAISESLSYLTRLIAEQRQRPGDGLLGMLVKEHGEDIDDRELAGLADGLLTGGLETTASMLALGSLILLQNPEHIDAVSGTDEAVNKFIEELLRYLSVVQVAFPRFARVDLEIAGVKIAKGDVVLCSLTGANRDRALGENMDLVTPGRMPTSHLAFGHGIHRCVGAELARMELRAAYPALVRRFPRMRLACDPADLTFRELSIVYGIDYLPVMLK